MGIFKEQLLYRNEARKLEQYTEIIELQKDPVKWEVAYWRLLGIVGEGREIARQISASPTVKEFGECVFSLFTPLGESIAFSRGILLHMASMGSSIQWMLRNDYEDDPGINEGDIFYNNDPQIGGAHAADQAVLLPFFYEGELVAWLGGLTHCMETGSTEPGGISPSALTRYDDGQMVPCQKVGRNYKFNRDFHIMVERNTRDGKWWILDDRAKLAACLKMRDSLTKLIDEIGVQYFKTVTMEMIEQGRKAALTKSKTVMFPGRYRTPVLYDTPFDQPRIRIPRDYLAHINGEMTVEADGHIIFDYDGTSSAGFYPNNSSYPCTNGQHIYTLLQDVFYDGMFNNGLEDAFTLKVREGACNAASIEFACSGFATAIASVGSSVTRNVAHSYFAMGYREEGFSNKAMTTPMSAGGVDQFGNQYGVLIFEMNCSGHGAMSNSDGLHAANAVWNPECNLSDAEMFEHVWPLMWLGRNILKDGGGYGRKQGGGCIESTFVVEHDIGFLESGANGSQDTVPLWGIMGGYPAPTRYKYIMVDSDYYDKIHQFKPIPHSEGDDPSDPDFSKMLNGNLKLYPAQQPADQFNRYDIIHQTSGGGGGWGDPIERDPQSVIDDIKMHFTSEWTAKNVYCVAWNQDTMEVDIPKTEEMRREMRKNRLNRGIPVSEYKQHIRNQILAGDIPKNPKETYNDCFKYSEKFLNEFRQYWSLDESFKGF